MASLQITQPSYFRVGIPAVDTPQARFLTFRAAEGGVELADAASEAHAGVSVEQMFAGKSQSYQIEGRVRVEAGDSVTLHAEVTCDNQGRAVAAASGNVIRGRAMTAAGQAGDFIDVELYKGRFAVPGT